MKKLAQSFIVFVTLLVALSPLAVSAQRSLDDIKKDGKITMATSADYPPFEWTIIEDGEAKIIGIEPELAQKIADKIGVELVIQDTSFESIVTQVSSGRVDFAGSGMSYTPEREKVVNFSELFYETTTSFVINKDNTDKLKTEEDFAKAKIGVQKGTVQEALAKEKFPEADITSMNKNGDLVEALKTGRIDGVMMDTIVVKEFVAQNEDVIAPVAELEILLGDDGFAFITHKDSKELLAVINEVIKETMESGEMDKIIDKYIEINASESAE